MRSIFEDLFEGNNTEIAWIDRKLTDKLDVNELCSVIDDLLFLSRLDKTVPLRSFRGVPHNLKDFVWWGVDDSRSFHTIHRSVLDCLLADGHAVFLSRYHPCFVFDCARKL